MPLVHTRSNGTRSRCQKSDQECAFKSSILPSGVAAVGCGTAHALPLPSIDRAWEMTPDPFSKNALQVPPAAGHPINRISELMPWVYRSTHEATALRNSLIVRKSG
jgi:hypothetical protein